MIKDELDHAKWSSEIKESLSKKQLLSPPNYEMILKAENVKFLLNRNLAKKIDNLDEAYEIAHLIESSEINNLFRLLANKFISSEDRKHFLLSEINEHQKKIMDFSKNFGDRVLRREIKAEENCN